MKLSTLGHFRKFEKNIELMEHKHVICHFKACDMEITNIQFVSRKIQILHFKKDFYKFCEIYYFHIFCDI